MLNDRQVIQKPMQRKGEKLKKIIIIIINNKVNNKDTWSNVWRYTCFWVPANSKNIL